MLNCLRLKKGRATFFDPKQLLRISCILWCYYPKCYSIIFRASLVVTLIHIPLCLNVFSAADYCGSVVCSGRVDSGSKCQRKFFGPLNHVTDPLWISILPKQQFCISTIAAGTTSHYSFNNLKSYKLIHWEILSSKCLDWSTDQNSQWRFWLEWSLHLRWQLSRLLANIT